MRDSCLDSESVLSTKGSLREILETLTRRALTSLSDEIDAKLAEAPTRPRREEFVVRMKAKRVFIVGGGGALGAYQIGALRYLEEAGIRPDDVMWRTIGNTGHVYARIEESKHQGAPVVMIEPGEEWATGSPLDMFNASPRKTRRLSDAGYRDAKRTIAKLAPQGHLPPSIEAPVRAAPRRRA